MEPGSDLSFLFEVLTLDIYHFEEVLDENGNPVLKFVYHGDEFGNSG